MIRFEKVNKAYDDKPVLVDFFAEFDVGATCIMGHSGVGKTTLINLLLGLANVDSGDIVRPDGIKYSCVFQEDRLVETMTALKNVIIVGDKSCRDKAVQILDALGIGDSAERKVQYLSGGMKRRVAIARALVVDASVYIFDEPFDGLDQDSKLIAAKTIQKYTNGKITIFVTHDHSDAKLLNAKTITL